MTDTGITCPNCSENTMLTDIGNTRFCPVCEFEEDHHEGF